MAKKLDEEFKRLKEELQLFFKLIKKAITKSPNKEIAHALLEQLLFCITNLDDPDLAQEFQKCWLKTKKHLQSYAEANHFLIQARKIELAIEKQTTSDCLV